MSDSPPHPQPHKVSNYSEDNLDRSESPHGDLERYDIDVHNLN